MSTFHKYNMPEFLSRYFDHEVALTKVISGGKLPALGVNGPWIAGGLVRRSLIGGTSVESDIDLFFRDEGQFNAASKWMSDNGSDPIDSNPNARAYSVEIDGKSVPVQFVRIGFFPDMESLIDSFDFTICQCSVDGESLLVGEYTLFDIARKRLALHKLTYGVATMRRLIKYTKQGFTACAGVMADILEAAVADPQLIKRSVEYVD